MATLEILMLVVPVLVRVTVFTARDPTNTWAKSTLEGEIVSADVVAELTVWLTPADVVGLKLASPGYEAVMVRGPAVRKVNRQLPFPADKVALQDSPVVAVTLTVPVGLLTAVTVTLTVTACEMFDGLGVFETIVAVLVALVAVTVFIAEAGL